MRGKEIANKIAKVTSDPHIDPSLLKQRALKDMNYSFYQTNNYLGYLHPSLLPPIDTAHGLQCNIYQVPWWLTHSPKTHLSAFLIPCVITDCVSQGNSISTAWN